MASKFKIKFKIQGLELEVEGSREDIPLINQALGQQVMGMLQPTSDIVEGEAKVIPISPTQAPNEPAKRKKRQAKSSTVASPEKDSGILDWKHNPEKWGTPNQDWTIIQKALWILFVVEHELGINELSVGSIANTFNKHFRQAKMIQSNHVSAALGQSKKKGKEALVGENTVANPTTWFLTTKGKELVQNSVNELKDK